MDADDCNRAVRSRDPRFDGRFITGVISTGIYCRPSCPVRTPERRNVRFFPTAAAAQATGLRACKRCQPDATPGSPRWSLRGDVAGRAMQLIQDGVVDRQGVSGLAARLGYSERQIHRHLVAEVGAGPQALARAQRAQSARTLLETTDLAVTDVAFSAGFTSLRQFNETIRTVFAATPSDLRRRRRGGTSTAVGPRGPSAGAGAVTVRLPYRAPLNYPALVQYLGARCVAGVEEVVGDTYRRTLRLPRGAGLAQVRPGATSGPPHLECTLWLSDLRDLAAAVQRMRRLMDLDADPTSVDEQLGEDPLLAPLVASGPGRRSPGAVDGDELVVRAVLGQQVSVAAARTHAGRLVESLGDRLPFGTSSTLTHLFPDMVTLARAEEADLPAVPATRRHALRGLAEAVAEGRVRIDVGQDRDETQRALLGLPGIGPWTAGYVRMRALADPDVFLPGDLAARRALGRIGLLTDPAGAAARASAWAPWRAYAMHHLWASLRAAEPDRGVVGPSGVRYSGAT